MERSIEEIRKTYQQYTPEGRGYEAGGVNADVLYLLGKIEELTRTNRTAAECIDRLRVEKDKLEAENARLREALAKYADGLNWTRHHTITKSGEVIFRSAEWLLSCDPKEYAEEALGGEHE